jgi:hypothetical protein
MERKGYQLPSRHMARPLGATIARLIHGQPMKTLFLTLALSLTALFACVASASVVVDQTYDGEEFTGAAHVNNSTDWPNASRDWSQAFRVGRTGEMIGIDLLLMRDESAQAPLLVDIRTMSNVGPTTDDEGTNVLAMASVLAEKVPTMPDVVGYDLTAAVMVHVPLRRFPVIEGQSLAIVLRASAPLDPGLGYMWLTGYAGMYPERQMFSRPPVSSQWTPGFNAAGFLTYVDAVPEPTTFMLSATSVVVLAVIRTLAGSGRSCRFRPARRQRV